MRRVCSVLILTALCIALLGGCRSVSSNPDGDDTPDATVNLDFSKTDSDMFTKRDEKTDVDTDESIYIRLNGDSVTATSDSVKIDGTKVTITENTTHILSGTLYDGMIIVDADDSAKLQLVLNGVQITSQTSAALYIRKADKVFLTLAQNTQNSLSNGGTFTAIDENNIDAALFSKEDLTLNGTGSLTVTSPGGHGIVCKDDLVITGGSYVVMSASHGLDANDSVRITGETTLSIDAGKDGIHCENNGDAELGFVYISGGTLDLEAEGDGISAGSYMQISDGTITVLAGGGSENGEKHESDSFGGFMGGGRPERPRSGETPQEGTSMKGMKAGTSLLISGGSFIINSADDGIHAASVVIHGGSFEIATGDDGVHADDTLIITDGTMEITESYEGLEALHLQIQGGNITLKASDDGLNAAGGKDSSGTEGGRDGMFGGGHGRPGGMGGEMGENSNGSIQISGGNLHINASGDGIDANGTLEISGGYIVVVGPTQGDTSTLDYDVSAVITGGTFIGTGAFGMAQTFSASSQGVLALRVGTQSAGTRILLQDQNGNTIVEHVPELDFEVVIISTPDMVSGQKYSIAVGSSSGEYEAS